MSFLSRLFRRGTSLAPAQAVTAIANRPMFMSPRSLQALVASAQSMPERTGWHESEDWWPHGSKPEHLITIVGDVGVIAVRGPLFQRFDIYTWWWGGTGYDMIVAAARSLAVDPRVKTIVLDLDSPGGQCSGCWDAVDALRAVAAVKPMISVINDDGFSACYAVATGSPRIVITRTGGAGSIGVRWTHLDVSKWNERVGVSYTEVVSGDKKTAMSPNAPLSAEAHAEMQAEVDRLADIFFDYVAAARPLTTAQVEAMQAGIYFGENAVAAGLADAVGTLESVLENAAPAPSGDVAENPPPAPDAPDASAAPLDIAATTEVAPVADAPDPAPPAAAAEVPDAPAPPGAETFATAVLASTLPAELQVALQRRGAQDQQPSEAIGYAASVRDLCVAAGIESVAADYVRANTSIETVRAQLLDAKADTGPEIVTALPQSVTADRADKPRESATDIYSRRRAAAAGAGPLKRQ